MAHTRHQGQHVLEHGRTADQPLRGRLACATRKGSIFSMK